MGRRAVTTCEVVMLNGVSSLDLTALNAMASVIVRLASNHSVHVSSLASNLLAAEWKTTWTRWSLSNLATTCGTIQDLDRPVSKRREN
jgi:hypothetical protein